MLQVCQLIFLHYHIIPAVILFHVAYKFIHLISRNWLQMSTEVRQYSMLCVLVFCLEVLKIIFHRVVSVISCTDRIVHRSKQ